MSLRKKAVFIALSFFFVLSASNASAKKIRVAVAANFSTAIKKIVPLFEKQNKCKVLLSFGSTGNIYAQIKQDAPYEIFLAADAKRPKMLEEEGKIVPGTRFTYATGKVALLSSNGDLKTNDDFKSVLQDTGVFHHLAIANPKTAPYGYAAEQVLEQMNLTSQLKPKIVTANNISQTYQFIDSGAADLAIVAYSQIVSQNGKLKRPFWVIPQELYDPIEQQAVLLKKGERNILAQKFVTFLKSPQIVKLIGELGYNTPPS